MESWSSGPKGLQRSDCLSTADGLQPAGVAVRSHGLYGAERTGSWAAAGRPSQADTPSAYSFDLTSPQKEGFEELATPELKNVTVVLPKACRSPLRGVRPSRL